MTNVRRCAAFIAALLCSCSLQAQIYEEKDAEGNTVFTDSPQQGASEVDLPGTNISDPVKPSGSGEPTPTHSSQVESAPDHKESAVVIPDSRNEELDQAREADMPHEVLEAEERHEVGDTITPEEAERRKEAQQGETVDAEGNIIRYEHRGHAGGGR